MSVNEFLNVLERSQPFSKCATPTGATGWLLFYIRWAVLHSTNLLHHSLARGLLQKACDNLRLCHCKISSWAIGVCISGHMYGTGNEGFRHQWYLCKHMTEDGVQTELHWWHLLTSPYLWANLLNCETDIKKIIGVTCESIEMPAEYLPLKNTVTSFWIRWAGCLKSVADETLSRSQTRFSELCVVP